MIKILLPHNDQIKYNRPILEWFKEFKQELKLGVDEYQIFYNLPDFINQEDFDIIYSQESIDDLIIVHPTLLMSNIKNLQMFLGTIHGILPYIKPIEDKLIKQFPFNQETAINKEFKIIYMDETPLPDDLDTHIIIVPENECIVTRELLTKKILELKSKQNKIKKQHE